MSADLIKSELDAGCKLYLQPVAFSSTEGEVLAGGWRRFLNLRATMRNVNGDVKSSVLSVADLQPLLNLPQVSALFEKLTQPRADFGGLTMAEPHLMGIVNVTPDSFSDGGDNFAAATAINQAKAMVSDGASILDIGGESTRPGADVVSVSEEIKRVAPVIEGLRGINAEISIDTRNPETMREAVSAGADFINDVTALEHSPASLETAVNCAKPVFLMHMKGQPKNMQNAPAYSHVVLDVYDYLESRLEACEAAGLTRSQIGTDVGIGFGKTLKHNTDLLANLSLFHGLGAPILLGASRKSFIDKVVGETTPKQRLPGSLVALLQGLEQGVQMTRVHDVGESCQAMRVWQVIHN
ncbi:MAG: dihydropteroate synthase [Alphaproteobacteria bacterium]